MCAEELCVRLSFCPELQLVTVVRKISGFQNCLRTAPYTERRGILLLLKGWFQIHLLREDKTIDLVDFLFFSESEIIYIRLCGISCLLKLICNSYFYTRIKPDDFLMIMALLRVRIFFRNSSYEILFFY